MNAEQNRDRNHNDDFSALQAHGGGIALVAGGLSQLSKVTVSDPIYKNGVFRFSVTSQ